MKTIPLRECFQTRYHNQVYIGIPDDVFIVSLSVGFSSVYNYSAFIDSNPELKELFGPWADFYKIIDKARDSGIQSGTDTSVFVDNFADQIDAIYSMDIWQIKEPGLQFTPMSLDGNLTYIVPDLDYKSIAEIVITMSKGE